MFILVLLDRFFVGLTKFRFSIVEYRIFIGLSVMYKNICMRRLRQRGNDFIAHWLMAEMISPLAGSMPNKFLHMFKTHAQPARNESMQKIFYRWLSQRGNEVIADWVYGAWFPILNRWVRPVAEFIDPWLADKVDKVDSDIGLSYCPASPFGYWALVPITRISFSSDGQRVRGSFFWPIAVSHLCRDTQRRLRLNRVGRPKVKLQRKALRLNTPA